jgi:hypothetical protein
VTLLPGNVSLQTTNWMYAFAFMVFVMWAIIPLFYFPSTVDPQASTIGQNNFFERLIYFRAQTVSTNNNTKLEGTNFQILVPQCFFVALLVGLPGDASRA